MAVAIYAAPFFTGAPTHRPMHATLETCRQWKLVYIVMHSMGARSISARHSLSHTYTRSMRHGWVVARQRTLTSYEAMFEIGFSVVTLCSAVLLLRVYARNTQQKRNSKMSAWKRKTRFSVCSFYSRGFNIFQCESWFIRRPKINLLSSIVNALKWWVISSSSRSNKLI